MSNIKSKFKRKGAPSGGGSQFDSQQTLKLGFDDNRQAHRFYNAEKPVFDRIEPTYDANGNLDEIRYLVAVDNERFELGTINDIGGSLNNKYFVISSVYDKMQFYVWFNVDSAGVDPSPIAGATGIEVPLEAGDSAIIVASAIEIVLKNNTEIKYLFDISRNNAVLNFFTKKEGPVTTNSIGDSGFLLNLLSEGTEEIYQIDKVEYDIDCNFLGFYKL